MVSSSGFIYSASAAAIDDHNERAHLPHPKVLVFRWRNYLLPYDRLRVSLLNFPACGFRFLVASSIKLQWFARRSDILDGGKTLFEVPEFEREARSDLL